MKKSFILILIVLLLITFVSAVKIKQMQNEKDIIVKFNYDYEKVYEKEVFGTEVATLINKAMNYNEQNKFSKDENGNYNENTDAVRINVQLIKDDEENKIEYVTYNMERIYSVRN